MMLQWLTPDACDAKTGYHKKDFGELLTDWLHFAHRDVKESTYFRYLAMVEKHIRPELGEIPLSRLSSKDIDCFTEKKLDHGNLNNQGSLSSKTVTGFLLVIRLALDYGSKRGYDCPQYIVFQNPRQNLPGIQVLTRKEQQKLDCAYTQIHAAYSES
ncbi:MAG: hypothetical protein HFG80_13300 [Eubacterium sp.]|nr:hypothetical protein [Eubacterium sp.]